MRSSLSPSLSILAAAIAATSGCAASLSGDLDADGGADPSPPDRGADAAPSTRKDDAGLESGDHDGGAIARDDGGAMARDGGAAIDVDGGAIEAADGSAPAAPEGCRSVSGSRLRVRRYTAEGADAVAIGLYDSELGIECHPESRGGELQCFPSRVEGLNIYYTTPDCSGAPLGRRGDRMTPTSPIGSGGGAYYVIGAPASVTPGAVNFRLNGTFCEPFLRNDEYPYYTLTAIAPGDIARLTRTTQPAATGARFQHIAYESDDGARLCAEELHDGTLGVDCRPGTADDGRTRCLPSIEVRTAQAFVDSTCTTTERIAIVPLGLEIVGSMAITAPDLTTGCPGYTWAYRLGDVGTTYRIFSGGCVVSMPETYIERSFEEQVSASSMSELERRVGPSTGRLAPIELVAEDGTAVVTTRFHDSELDLDCTVVHGEHCVPISYLAPPGREAVRQTTQYFTDPGCTTSIELGLAPSSCTDPDYALDRGTAYPVLERHTGATYRISEGGGCIDAALTSMPSTYLYRLGAPLPASSFAAGVLAAD
jgi:hypothetical protein